jgi:hypothetical protein
MNYAGGTARAQAALKKSLWIEDRIKEFVDQRLKQAGQIKGDCMKSYDVIIIGWGTFCIITE